MTGYTILMGGELLATPRLREQIAGTRVIAADSGIRHAKALGLVPELWAGDFDSASDVERAEHAEVPVARYPADKDITDGEIAIEAALERGAQRLIFAGAFGGDRADHEFLHLALAMRMAERGIDVLLSSGRTEARPLLTGATAFDYPAGTVFSVLGFEELIDLTLTGVKWPLDKRFVPFGSSLTLSNEVTGSLSASLAGGRAMLVAHLDPMAG